MLVSYYPIMSALGGINSDAILNMNEWMSATTNRARLACCSMLNSLHFSSPGPILLFSLITTINVWMGSTCSSRFVVAERNETIYRQQLTTIPRFPSESPQRAPVRWLSQRKTLATTKTTSPIWPTAFGAQSGLSMLLMMMTRRVELPAYSSCEMSHVFHPLAFDLTWNVMLGTRLASSSSNSQVSWHRQTRVRVQAENALVSCPIIISATTKSVLELKLGRWILLLRKNKRNNERERDLNSILKLKVRVYNKKSLKLTSNNKFHICGWIAHSKALGRYC